MSGRRIFACVRLIIEAYTWKLGEILPAQPQAGLRNSNRILF